MAKTGSAPRNATWLICLVLYLIAAAHHFGIVRVGAPLATWSWLVGFAILLIASKVRGL